MEKSQERLSRVRDGQEELGMEGMEPGVGVLGFWEMSGACSTRDWCNQRRGGDSKDVAAANGPHRHESFRKRSEVRNKHEFLGEKK